jgi:hypothetical protein
MDSGAAVAGVDNMVGFPSIRVRMVFVRFLGNPKHAKDDIDTVGENIQCPAGKITASCAPW